MNMKRMRKNCYAESSRWNLSATHRDDAPHNEGKLLRRVLTVSPAIHLTLHRETAKWNLGLQPSNRNLSNNDALHVSKFPRLSYVMKDFILNELLKLHPYPWYNVVIKFINRNFLIEKSTESISIILRFFRDIEELRYYRFSIRSII